MVGLVVVSHSAALAQAALGLALEMVHGEPPRVVLAAGMADGGFGTDAARVAEAIDEANDGGGVVVLTDLGSAVLSAQMGVEFLPDPDTPVRIVPAPFVEGLLAAVVSAAGGATLDEVAAEASSALRPKQEQLGEEMPDAGGPGPAGGNELVPGTAPGSPGSPGSPGDDGAQPVGETAQGAGAGGLAVGGPAPEASASAVLINPMGLHARPAAALAAAVASFDAAVQLTARGRGPVNAKSPLSVAGLGTSAGDEVVVTASGPDAQAAVEHVAAMIAGGFGEAEVSTDPLRPAPGSTVGSGTGAASAIAAAGGASTSATVDPAVNGAGQSPSSSGTGAADPSLAGALPTGPRSPGLGVSPGRVLGPAVHMPPPLAAPTLGPALAPEARVAEARRLEEAASDVVQALKQRARAAHGEAAAILEATAALAADPAPVEAALAAIRDRGADAQSAAWDAYSEVAAHFRAAGGALAERASDVNDLRSRVVAALRGVQPPGVPVRSEPFVLVARDLAPADTAGLSADDVLAIVASEGGPTSHTAILARSLGIPAVVGWAGADGLAEGAPVLVDGSTGEVVQNPSPEQAAGARTAPEQAESVPFTGGGATSDGHSVDLLANVGGARDAAAAARAGATGVGLFRTEFAFLDRPSAPSEDEQAQLYTQVLRHFEGGKVVLRTLDSGSDKPLPFLAGEPEENPALGVRGLRTAWAHPELLRTQLAAMARAQAQVPHAAVWVMAPMVATAEEAAWFAGLAREAGLRTAGVMVETPAAALCSAAVFEHVDFVSLGSNDLAQYTMAADRLSAPLAQLNDPWQPAVLALVAATVAGSAGKPVGVCGEAAGNPELACVLVGLGVTSLSMNPRSLGPVQSALAGASLETCRAAAAAALAAPGAAEAKAAALAVLEDGAAQD